MRAYEQEALAAVEQNAEDVVATPLASQQRGKEHAPPLADHEETRWEREEKAYTKKKSVS